MKKLVLAATIWAFNTAAAHAQNVSHIEPPSWWVGMEMDTVEFMVYGASVAECQASSSTLTVLESKALESPNYLFVKAVIPADLRPGAHYFEFKNGKGKRVAKHAVSIFEREQGSAQRKGFSSADIIYLLTPDRFRNGNPKNDQTKGMLEGPNRNFRGGRHGGDLEGVIQSLDYIKDLGVSSLWLNPVLENNMPDYSYHGYAMTNLYQVDPRYGNNELFKNLAEQAQERGMGLIMDQVANHIGSEHPWMKDLPSADWVHQWEEFTQTNHMKVSRFDPHGAEVDRKQFTDGWFVETMPDLNQRQAQLATYLIQNSIWWAEYLGLQGIRMDTWSYPDKEFLAVWTKALLNEYPNFNIVGEEWVSDPSLISYWQSGVKTHDGYESFLPSIMDFPLQTAVVKGLNGAESWKSAMTAIYESLANDYMYADANDIMIFPDNHDMSRIFVQLGEDYNKWKMAMALYYTMRGTLQIYYGTEILMRHEGSDHGDIRADFPGGWEGDPVNAFTGEGLTDLQQDALKYMQKLGKLRRNSCALNMGALLHFIPDSEIYVYFRTFEDERIMVIHNRNATSKSLNMARFKEGLGDSQTGENLLTGENEDWSTGELSLDAMESLIIHLK